MSIQALREQILSGQVALVPDNEECPIIEAAFDEMAELLGEDLEVRSWIELLPSLTTQLLNPIDHDDQPFEAAQIIAWSKASYGALLDYSFTDAGIAAAGDTEWVKVETDDSIRA